MMYRRLIPTILALALMGQGCMATSQPRMPNPAEKTPVPAPAPEPTPEPTPAPATKPAPTPTKTPAPTSGTQIKPKTVTVEMKDDAFSPQIIAINAGDTVVWKNVGTHSHTSAGLVNGPLLWDSGSLLPGKTYSRKFEAVGRYDYRCSVHAGMTGSVIVGEVNATR